jgi:hypothetical protein
MKRYEKKQILELLETVSEAHGYVKNQIVNKNHKAAIEMLENCQECAVQICKAIEKSEGESNDIIAKLEKYYELVNQLSQSLGDYKSTAKYVKRIEESIEVIANHIKVDIKAQIEILFLPYKASMWTSLESIWKAADEDEDCNAIVMPIPYYNIGNPASITETYEGDMFPKDVPITDYRTYIIEENKPDVIVIHNPYDEYNNLTRVHPKYFSSNLKNHTDCLVYSPYFSFGTYIPEKSDFLYMQPATLNADKIIVQSEKVKRIFNKYGFADDKFIVSGSPKVDAIVNARKEDVDIPKNWIDKLSGKKVFLMNTHLSYFPTSFSNKTKSGNYAVRFHDEILKAIINKEDVGMIWRPHPLLKNMIMSRFQECGDYIKYFEETISQSSNCVVDYSGDYRPAFFYSHALISTWSSLVNEYMVTGKPVMFFQRQLSADVAAQSPLNRNINYFRFGKNGITFEEFIEMVSKDEDPMYEERMKMIRQGFVNIDGSAGEKAYLKIKNELL